MDDGFDFTGISFPTPLTEIPKVEAQNNARINVFRYDEGTQKINILHVSEHEGEDALEVDAHVLRNHVEHCKGAPGRPTRIEMPEKGKNTLKFKNFNRKAPVPWVMYFDFESIIRKHATCINNPGISSTTKTTTHVPCGFSLIAVRSDGHYKGPLLYRGEDCVEVFLRTLQELECVIREELEEKKLIRMTENDWYSFRTARRCQHMQEGSCPL